MVARLSGKVDFHYESKRILLECSYGNLLVAGIKRRCHKIVAKQCAKC